MRIPKLEKINELLFSSSENMILKLIYKPENDIDIDAPAPERRGPPRR